MTNFFTPLDHLGLMTVSGKDTLKFLQGQLTCDVEKLHTLQSRPGASCDVKGRVLSSFRVWKLDYDRVALEMSADLLNDFIAHLKKYAVFFQCEIRDESRHYQRYGLCGSESRELLSRLFPSLPEKRDEIVRHDNNYLLLVDDHSLRFEFWAGSDEGDWILEELKTSLEEGSAAEWDKLDIEAGLYRVDKASSGLYTPQPLNYDLNGHVDFDKGCYTGQEIVARMHYRGKAKRRLYRLSLKSEQPVAPGTVVVDKSGKNLGNILRIVEDHDSGKKHYQALASLDTSATEQDLSLEDTPGARLTLQPSPLHLS